MPRMERLDSCFDELCIPYSLADSHCPRVSRVHFLNETRCSGEIDCSTDFCFIFRVGEPESLCGFSRRLRDRRNT